MSEKKPPAVKVKSDLVKIQPLELLTEAWNMFRPRWSKVLSVLVVAFLIQAVGEESLKLVEKSYGEYSSRFVLFGLLFSVVQIFISAGLVYTVLKIVRGKEFAWTDLFTQTNRFIKYFLTTLVLSLYIAVGLIALVIPGIYFLLKFWPVMYLAIDRSDLKIRELFKLSGQMTEGIKWQILIVELVIVALNIGGALLFGLGLIITIPVSYLAGAILYDKLLVRIDNQHSPKKKRTTKP